MNNKAIIAMSGGVDSSVAAYICKEDGYDCIGATMKLFDNEDIGKKEEKSCCSLEDVEDARSVAAKLGMPYYVFNFTDEFEDKVIRKFINAYESGITPNPCIDCNRFLKFEKLFNRMREIEFDYVATGHYARIEKEADRFLLKKGIDATKDQSYVLYSLTQEQLAHTLFPLGSFTKAQIREIAEDNGFINAKKKDSQDICFVPDGDYASFIEGYLGKTYPEGDFVDFDGNVLGTHKGLIRYTIGQRKGLGLSLPKPMYVCRLCTDTNCVMLGDNDDLFSKALDADDINLITTDRIEGSIRAEAKVRYSQAAQKATVWQTDENSLHIEFDEPQRAVTAGQAVVLYDGDTVIGGGTIK